jgi:phage FluMu protein Com
MPTDRRHYDYRHKACNRLLFRGYLAEGSVIQIRCPKCGKMVVYKSGVANNSRFAILIDEEAET